MTNKEPVAEPMLSSDDASVAPWEQTQPLLGKAPAAWLATVRPDGKPHVVPVGAVWMDDLLYFTTGQGTRKEKNVEQNPHVSISFSGPGFDVVIEGEAARMTDAAKLERLAGVYAAQGWPATAGDGALDAPFSAPTTGPAPYNVYEVTPTTAFAFGTEDETVNKATRYRF